MLESFYYKFGAEKTIKTFEKDILQIKNPRLSAFFIKHDFPVKGADIQAHSKIISESKDIQTNLHIILFELRQCLIYKKKPYLDLNKHCQVLIDSLNAEINYKLICDINSNLSKIVPANIIYLKGIINKNNKNNKERSIYMNKYNNTVRYGYPTTGHMEKCNLSGKYHHRSLKEGRHSCVSRDLISPSPKAGGVDAYRPSELVKKYDVKQKVLKKY